MSIDVYPSCRYCHGPNRVVVPCPPRCQPVRVAVSYECKHCPRTVANQVVTVLWLTSAIDGRRRGRLRLWVDKPKSHRRYLVSN